MARAIINGTDLDIMRDAIAPKDTDYWRDRYAAGDFPRADVTKDVDMRYRWDLFWAAGGYNLFADMTVDGSDLLDAHIDTALRNIVAPLAASV